MPRSSLSPLLNHYTSRWKLRPNLTKNAENQYHTFDFGGSPRGIALCILQDRQADPMKNMGLGTSRLVLEVNS